MTNSHRAMMIRLLVFGILAVSTTGRAESRPPIAEAMAKAYGLDSFGQIEAIRFTLNSESPGVKVSHKWQWEPKLDRVTYEGEDKDGKPIRVGYLRSQLKSEGARVMDPSFMNDQYLLLFPLHIAWDASADVKDTGMHKLPLGKGSAKRVVVKYPAQGGYTPGDTWELYVSSDSRIQEFIYRRGGPKKPSLVVTTWEDYKKIGPLLISMDHRGTVDGKPLRVFFSDVSVKLAGLDLWVNAQ